MTRRRAIWSGCLLALGSLAASLLALHLVVASWFPFAGITWPGAFDPRVGNLFQPRGEVRYTNLLDFAVAQQANSLGFLDREPPKSWDPTSFRILILGDSFVEALQVPIEQKLQVQLQSLLERRYPDRRFEILALGHSSAGTAAELAYYETYGRDFDPDLVILVFVHNDFSDNSPLLAGIGQGWHPDHAPWPLFVEDASTGAFGRLVPDPHYKEHPIAIEDPPDPDFGLREATKWSHLGQWAMENLWQRFRWSARKQRELETRRIASLRTDDRFRDRLEGWRYPADLDRYEMFFAKDMPPAFDDAVRATDHAFARFADEKRDHGFEMIVAAIPPCSLTPWYRADKRELVDRGLLLRLQEIASRHGLSVLDLYPEFAQRGDPESAHWRHDSHWNATGHRWAAEAIASSVATRFDERIRSGRSARPSPTGTP